MRSSSHTLEKYLSRARTSKWMVCHDEVVVSDNRNKDEEKEEGKEETLSIPPKQ